MNVSGLPDQPSGIKAFHGTADDFVKFELGHPNRKDVGWLGHGLYFTNSPEMAMANAKMKAARKGPKAAPRVMSVRLNIQNPYYATLEDKARLQKANSSDASMAFTEALKGKGHDGVIWKSGDYHEYVAFHPDQVEVLPEEKAEGGKVDSDLKTAQRLGMDTSSIPEIRKAGQLREAHKSLGEKVRERAEESYKRALEYHQSGKLPFPVGTRFITEKTRKMNQLPFKVVGHYVDGKDPDRYGYRTEQGNKGDPNYSSSLLMVSDPAGDARMEKIGKPFDRKAWWDSVQVLKGPTQVKAEGGPVTLDEMKLALLDRKAGGGQPERKVSPIGFYSPAAEAARNLPQETGTPEQMAAMLAKQRGVSDEMQHSGYGQKMTAPKVSRQDLVAHFESQMPDVQETVLGEGRVKSFEEWLADQGLSPSAVNEFGGTLRRSYEAFKNNNSQRAGGHKYSEHQLPGGENYREVLLTLPEKPKKETWEWYDPIEQESKQGFATQQEAYANRPNIGAVVSKVEAKDSPQNYQSPHWDQPNVLAHIRLNDRTDAEGKKVLFVEEMQSDWGQQGKKKGFYDPNKKPLSRKEFDSYTDNLLNDYVEKQIQAGEDVHSANRRGMHTPFPQMAQELGRAEEYAGMRERRDIGMNSNARIPSAPFVTNTNHWVNLALKRIAKMAVDGGYDKVAFVNGNQSADRYDLSKQVGSVHYFPEGDGVGKGTLIAMPIGEDINSSSESAMTHDNVAPEDLSKYVGKEVAEKMLNAPKVNGMHSVSGEGLKVGGEGMKAFYDKIVPAAINKLLPKIGGKKLGAVHLVNKAHDFDLDDLGNATPEELAQLEAGGVILHQPGFEVTPEMREHVQKGLPIFKTGGVMRGYAGGGTAQGTTMPTLAQMKMALMGLPKNLGSIGAQEAPDMNPKAYFPPDRQGRLPPGGAALTSGMPIGGIDMSSQMGQQLMPQQLMPQQGAQSPQGVQNPQVGPQEQGGLAAPQEAPQEPQQASSSGILGLTPQGQTMGALKPPMKAARGGGINYPTIDPKTLQNENDGANLQPVNWMGGGDVEGMAKGGEFKFSIKPSGLAKTSSGNFTPYDDQRPSIKTLATAFNEAIAHHLSLSPEDRVANSQRAANAVAEHIGRTQQGKPKDLLGKNAKLVKTEKGGSEAIKLPDNRGVETTGLALSPAYQEKQFQTCPNHASCKAECLGKTSGNYFKLGGGDDLTAFKGPRLNSLRKTQAFLRDPHSFAVKLYDEIQAAKDMAAANGNHLGVRLNVLSDISPLVHESIIKGHPDVTFYDYTKNKSNPIAENHHYTYSSTGVSQPGVENPNTNWARMRKRLENGENVAMAFSHKEHLPTEVHDQETGKVYRVVNGDTHDFRPLDIQPEGESGVIIGLKNKKATGKVSNAHKDSKGFFVHYDPQLKMNPNGTYQRSSVPRVTKEGKPKLGETIPQNTRVNIMPQGKVAEAFDNDGEKA